jgi:CubicO group peptidase (beta-lactamase class C family)
VGQGINVFLEITPDGISPFGRIRSALRRAAWRILPSVFLPTPGAIVQELMADHGIPALSLAIAKRGTIIFSQGFGYADPQWRQMVTAQSLFRIASGSKALTAAAIHVLAQRGALSLSERVFGDTGILGHTYGTKPYSNWLVQIEVKHLLEHTAGGWPNDANDPMFRPSQLDHTALITATLDDNLLTRPSGVEHIYSNFGYCILGRVIERRSGQRYEDFVRQSILIPAGANGMRIAGDTLADRAPGEVVYVSDGGSPYAMPVRRMDSHGGWIASAADYVRFLLAIDKPVGVGNVLSDPSITAMRTPWNPSDTIGYGHGVVTNRANIWHSGFLPGSRSMMWGGANGNAWCVICTGGPGSVLDKGDPLEAMDKMMWRLWDLV